MIIDPIRKIKLFMTCDIGVVRTKNTYAVGKQENISRRGRRW